MNRIQMIHVVSMANPFTFYQSTIILIFCGNISNFSIDRMWELEFWIVFIFVGFSIYWIKAMVQSISVLNEHYTIASTISHFRQITRLFVGDSNVYMAWQIVIASYFSAVKSIFDRWFFILFCTAFQSICFLLHRYITDWYSNWQPNCDQN